MSRSFGLSKQEVIKIMKCKVCGVTPIMGGATLIRQKTNEVGIWCCESHSKPMVEPLAQVVADIQYTLQTNSEDIDALETPFSFLKKLQKTPN